MTHEEAIKILEELSGDCSNDEEYLATHIAIESIQKQTPKNPVVERDWDSYNCHCPNCGKFQTQKIGSLWFNGGQYSYCKYCGQALNWSDIDSATTSVHDCATCTNLSCDGCEMYEGAMMGKMEEYND